MTSSDSPNDGLQNLFDDYDQAAEPGPQATEPRHKQPARRGTSKRVYRSPLEESQSDRRKIARATGKKASVAGQYVRRSFTFRPDQLESIEQMARQLGLSQNDLMRWFTDMGIDSVTRGKKPPLAEEVRRKYDPGVE